MHQDQEMREILQTIAEKGLRLLTQFHSDPTQFSQWLMQYQTWLGDFQSMMNVLLDNPEKIWGNQQAYLQDAASLLQSQFKHWMAGTAMPIPDKRFHTEAWVNNPFFNLLSQQYLLASEHFRSLLVQLEYVDKPTARRVQFFAQQHLDALSPDNFLQTNPQLIAETIQSHGKNLLRGLNNFLDDIDVGSARLITKMTDTTAFTLGKNIATTPGNVIYRNELIELIQYTPQTAEVKSIPLLIIPPWINKYYILDLSPENSFIDWIVKQGITVFCISWVNPDAGYAKKGLFAYLNEGPNTAIQVIKEQLSVGQVNTLGFCIGGTLLSMLLSYHHASADHSVHTATFLASLMDFSDPGDISAFIDKHQIAQLEEKMKAQGYLEGQFMANTFNSLRASDLIWSFFIKNYLQGKHPVPFDILFWNADSTNMPAKMHSQYLRWMYLHNYLVKPGKIRLNHVPIDINKIDIPTFFISTQKDHIAPWKTTYLGFNRMKGSKTFLLGGSGHIAGIINSPATKKYSHFENPANPPSATEWLEKATEHAGSWWPTWMTWLKAHSGKSIKAPIGDALPYKGLMEAPGSYVLMTSKK